MSERYTPPEARGDYSENRREYDPLLEIRGRLSRLDELLAKLIERSGNLSPIIKKQLRFQIQDILYSLGLKDTKELTVFRERIGVAVADRRRNPLVPQDYPSTDEFARDISVALTQGRPSGWYPSPQVEASASRIAEYGYANWRELQARSSNSLIEYTYKLGKAISDPLVYSESFAPKDGIIVQGDWRVVNGRHRALALVTLGDRFVRSNGLNHWVSVQPEEQVNLSI